MSKSGKKNVPGEKEGRTSAPGEASDEGGTPDEEEILDEDTVNEEIEEDSEADDDRTTLLMPPRTEIAQEQAALFSQRLISLPPPQTQIDELVEKFTGLVGDIEIREGNELEIVLTDDDEQLEKDIELGESFLELLKKGDSEGFNTLKRENPDFILSIGDIDLSGMDLSGIDLSGAYIVNSDLCGADLSWAILSRTRFNGSNLTGASLTGANLFKADLTGVDLTGADLSGALGVELAQLSLTDSLWAVVVDTMELRDKVEGALDEVVVRMKQSIILAQEEAED